MPDSTLEDRHLRGGSVMQLKAELIYGIGLQGQRREGELQAGAQRDLPERITRSRAQPEEPAFQVQLLVQGSTWPLIVACPRGVTVPPRNQSRTRLASSPMPIPQAAARRAAPSATAVSGSSRIGTARSAGKPV